jgi:SAM-dependent methyltransferase
MRRSPHLEFIAANPYHATLSLHNILEVVSSLSEGKLTLVQKTPESPLRIDIGCGGAKREGFIGVDSISGPAVDYVLDVTKARLPFDDATVDHVFSSHFLEHIKIHFHVFQEIGRVAKEGAKIEFWTPYAFSNEAFLYGHEMLLTEELWMHLCVHFRDLWSKVMVGRWQFRNVNYVVREETEKDLLSHGVSMDFAIRYYKGVVLEFGVEFEFTRNMDVPAILPRRTYSYTREGERFPLTQESKIELELPRPVTGWRSLVPPIVKRNVRKLLKR